MTRPARSPAAPARPTAQAAGAPGPADWLPDAVLALAGDGRILSANAAAGRLFGAEPAALAGRPAAALLAPRADTGRWLASLEAAPPAPASLLLEIRCRRESAGDFAAEIALARAPAGADHAWTAVVRDITGRQASAVLDELRITQRQLASAQAVAHLGYVDIDRSVGRRMWSPEMFDLFGFPRAAQPPPLEAMLGRIHPEDRPRIQQIIDRSYQTGELAGTIEYRLILPDGRLRWIRNVARHEGGATARIMSIYLDITDLKFAEESARAHAATLAATVDRLERTRERLEHAQQIGRIGDIEADLRTRERHWSPEVFRLHGFDPADQPPPLDAVTARVHVADRAALNAFVDEGFAGTAGGAVEYRVILPGGTVRWLQLRGQRVAGDPQRVASTVQDITERKAAEESLRQAIERERELGRLKADFLHMITHEYRTPLGVITSSAEILERYFDRLPAGDRREALESIRASSRRLANLMEEVLFLGRAESGRIPLELRPRDVPRLVREIAGETVAALGAARDVRIDCAGFAGPVAVDERLLRHIAGNLLSNALKYSPPERPVRVRLAHADGQFTLVVRDEGIGIPAPHRSRLFEMFGRAPNVGTVSGTGLGLVVVKHCLAIYGGRIDLQSEEGRGTEVTVLLPAPAAAENSPATHENETPDPRRGGRSPHAGEPRDHSEDGGLRAVRGGQRTRGRGRGA